MTVAPVVGATSPRRIVPYISTDMFMYDGRRGVAVDQLTPGGKSADNRAALEQYIESASGYIDSTCQQTLVATVDTWVTRAAVNRQGFVVVHPRYRPVIALTAFAMGPQASPASMVPFSNLSGAIVAPNYFQVPAYVGGLPVMTNQGAIQFGTPAAVPGRAYVQCTYQNGYPVSYLTADVAEGATSISVADTTGVVEGLTYLTVYAGKRRWQFLAGEVSTSGSNTVGTGPGTIGCLPVPWDIPAEGPSHVMVSALPPDVIQAAVLITRAFIKDAGVGNISSPAIENGQSAGDNGVSADLAEAVDILRPYVAPLA